MAITNAATHTHSQLRSSLYADEALHCGLVNKVLGSQEEVIGKYQDNIGLRPTIGLLVLMIFPYYSRSY